MPIGEPALVTALILSAVLGIWGLARVFQVSSRFSQLESSHDQRASVLIALAAAESKRDSAESSKDLNQAS